jgi:hypothetical protein
MENMVEIESKQPFQYNRTLMIEVDDRQSNLPLTPTHFRGQVAKEARTKLFVQKVHLD